MIFIIFKSKFFLYITASIEIENKRRELTVVVRYIHEKNLFK